MDKLLSDIFNSIYRYFDTLGVMFNYEEKLTDFLFKKDSEDESSDSNTYKYNFFVYTIFSLYILMFLSRKVDEIIAEKSGFYASIVELTEMQVEKHLLYYSLALLLLIHVIIFLSSNSKAQRKLLLNYTINVLNRQLVCFFVTGLIAILLHYSGVLDDELSFFESLLLVVFTLFYIFFIIGISIGLPIEQVNYALKEKLIDSNTSKKLKLFTFLPILIWI